MKTALTLTLLLTATLAMAPAQEQRAQIPAGSPPGSETLEVAMVERGPTTMRFEPSDLVVRKGDVVRFVQRGIQPHNVEFTEWPDAAGLGELRMGPFLMGKGEVYEFVIDNRFVPGEYRIVCTPHVLMGMVGTITVLAAEDNRP